MLFRLRHGELKGLRNTNRKKERNAHSITNTFTHLQAMMTSCLAQMCVGKQWVRGRGGRLKRGDCTSAADCGKIQQVF